MRMKVQVKGNPQSHGCVNRGESWQAEHNYQDIHGERTLNENCVKDMRIARIRVRGTWCGRQNKGKGRPRDKRWEFTSARWWGTR